MIPPINNRNRGNINRGETKENESSPTESKTIHSIVDNERTIQSTVLSTATQTNIADLLNFNLLPRINARISSPILKGKTALTSEPIDNDP